MQMSNKAYDICKWLCMVVIPAFNVLLSIINDAWNYGLPVASIISTTSGVAAFIGALCGFSTIEYNKNING